MSIAEIEISEWRIPTSKVPEEEIERRLVEEGLIRVPSPPGPPPGEFIRINIGGKPISETIIEERR